MVLKEKDNIIWTEKERKERKMKWGRECGGERRAFLGGRVVLQGDRHVLDPLPFHA